MDQRKIVVFIVLVFLSFGVYSQNLEKDNSSLVKIAKQFLGKPYRGHMLSKANPEQFISSNEAFDCVTFLEHSLATKISKGKVADFPAALIHVRYAGDSVRYEKRYHYFSDAMWHLAYPIIQHPVRHSIAPKDFHFLSNFIQSQKLPTIDLSLLDQREQQLRSRPFYYTANRDLRYVLPLIQDGDLIGLVGKKDDLDYLHTAMAIRKGNQVYLLHASQEQKKVVISTETLGDYLITHRQFIGISVFRPKFNE